MSIERVHLAGSGLSTRVFVSFGGQSQIKTCTDLLAIHQNDLIIRSTNNHDFMTVQMAKNVDTERLVTVDDDVQLETSLERTKDEHQHPSS